LDVLNESGKLMMEFVALRDLQPGEEIFIDYGHEWEASWEEHSVGEFRNEIGMPDGFFPDNWMKTSAVYEVASFAPLKPGEVVHLKWDHNGEPPISDSAHAVHKEIQRVHGSVRRDRYVQETTYDRGAYYRRQPMVYIQ
jgi:hypothetical protein